MADDSISSLLGDINAATKEAPLTTPEMVQGFSRSYLAGPSFGFADNAEAAIAAISSLFGPETYGQAYGRNLERIRGEQARFKRGVDYLDNLVEIGSGAILNPLAMAGNAMQGARYGASTLTKLATNPISQSAIAAVGEDNGQDPFKAAMMGAAVGTAGAVVSNKLGKFIGSADQESDRLLTSAYGVTGPDVSRSLRKMGDAVDNLALGDSPPLVNSLRKFQNEGVINASNDVLENTRNLSALKAAKSAEIGNLIRDANEIVPANPNFQMDNILEYTSSLSGTGRKKAEDAAIEELLALQQDIGAGTLVDLQRAKTGLNYRFDNTNPYKDDVIKIIRQDLRAEIEKRVDQAAKSGLLPDSVDAQKLKTLNREFGEIAEVKDLFAKKAGRDYGSDVVDDLMLSGSTTGKNATGALNIAGAVSGNPAYFGASALLQAAKVPAAKAQLSTALKEADQLKLNKIGDWLEKYGTARNVEAAYEATQPEAPYKGEDLSVNDLLAAINQMATREPQAQVAPAPSPTPARKPILQNEIDSMFKPSSTGGQKGGEVMPLKAETVEKVKKIDDGKFVQKVGQVADSIGADPEDLLQVIHFETGGSFDAAQKNKAGSGATGLIQFMPATAKELTGAATKEAATRIMSEMTPTEQLDYVEKYLKPFAGKINNLEDLYMAVLYPKAVGKDSEYALFKRGTTAYWQNRGLDINDDGIITKAEASTKVLKA